MLVATQFESIENIEQAIKNSVNNRVEVNIDDYIHHSYSLEESRLELRPSVKTVTCSQCKDVKMGKGEVILSQVELHKIVYPILDMLPYTLRQQFAYESNVTDKIRTTLLQKDLTIVTLIQEIQDNLKDDIDIEAMESELTTITAVNEIKENETKETETSDLLLLEDDEEESLIADFSLEADTEIADDFSLEDDEEEEVFSLDDAEDNCIDIDEEIDELDTYIEDTEEDNDEDADEELDIYVEDTEEYDDENENILENDTENEIIYENENIDKNIENKSDNSSQEPMSELDVFKSIITSGVISEPHKRTNIKKPIDDEEIVGIENLESISEDELENLDTEENTTFIEDDFDINEDEIVQDSEDSEDEEENVFEDEENEDFEDDTDLEEDDEEEDVFEDEDEEEEEDVFEDEDEEEEEDVFEDEDEEDDAFEDEEDEDLESDIDFEDEIAFEEDTEVKKSVKVVAKEEQEDDLYIKKVEDNNEFLDTSKVTLTKPNIKRPEFIPKSELGVMMGKKIKSSERVKEKQAFKQSFNQQTEEVEEERDLHKEFKSRMQQSNTTTVKQSPQAVKVKSEPEELPPLRTYLKKHPYTAIEELLQMGYTNAEIKEGLQRGRLLKKNGTLRAVY